MKNLFEFQFQNRLRMHKRSFRKPLVMTGTIDGADFKWPIIATITLLRETKDLLVHQHLDAHEGLFSQRWLRLNLNFVFASFLVPASFPSVDDHSA